MTLQVFRGIDRPSAFFGIRGRYLTVTAAVMAVAMVVSLLVGRMTNGLIGIITFLCAGGVTYLGVLYIQGLISDRALSRRLNARRLPSYLHLHPQRIRTLLNS